MNNYMKYALSFNYLVKGHLFGLFVHILIKIAKVALSNERFRIPSKGTTSFADPCIHE